MRLFIDNNKIIHYCTNVCHSSACKQINNYLRLPRYENWQFIHIVCGTIGNFIIFCQWIILFVNFRFVDFQRLFGSLIFVESLSWLLDLDLNWFMQSFESKILALLYYALCQIKTMLNGTRVAVRKPSSFKINSKSS